MGAQFSRLFECLSDAYCRRYRRGRVASRRSVTKLWRKAVRCTRSRGVPVLYGHISKQNACFLSLSPGHLAPRHLANPSTGWENTLLALLWVESRHSVCVCGMWKCVCARVCVYSLW